MTKLEALTKQFQLAVARMEEVLKEERTVFMRDAAVKRFEFTFDLAWKVMRSFLEEKKGASCAAPKDCVREAYRQGMIGYDEAWIEMTDWRNEIVHEYSEAYADELYDKLPGILSDFQGLLAYVLSH